MRELDHEQRQYYAREILDNPLFQEIMEKLETEAINRAVTAQVTDHLVQQAALAEVRAVRSFRRNCESIIRNNPVAKPAPA